MKYNVVRFKISGRNGKDMPSANMQDARDLLAALAGEAGFETFEDTDEGTDGYIQADATDKDAIDGALSLFPLDGVNITYTIEEAEDRNWNSVWEDEGFAPIIIDNRCIIHDTKHHAGQEYKGAMDITIDARLAFGTGTHETTRMIVTRLLGTDLQGKRVLDCGCGTGILSIVASKCGATAVTGYDIDEWSVRNTEHNARINDVENITVMHGDAGIISGIEGRFDIVLANINRNILLNDMPEMVNKMTTGSTLIISGFYENDEPLLEDRATALGLKLTAVQRANGWSMMVFGL